MSSPCVHSYFEKATSTWQYIIADPETKKAVIIDPVLDFNPASGAVTTESADELLACVSKEGYVVERIMESHAHADHLTAAQYLKQKLGEKVVVCIGQGITFVQKVFKEKFNLKNFADDGSQFDYLWKDNEEWSLGSIKCRVLSTPGHTNDSVSYLIGDCLFTGDSIFQPDVGTARCDFPGGSSDLLFQSIQKIFGLPETTRVFVGHDYPPASSRQPLAETSVKAQKEANLHVKNGTSLAEFAKWRSDRDKTLGAPRLLFPAIQVNIRAGNFPEPEDNKTVYVKIPISFSK